MAARRLNPFVCVHGAGGGGWEYDLWKPAVKQEGASAFVAPDLVPTNSSGGLGKTTFDDYAAQVRGWIAGLGNGAKPVLVGASMGGVLALHAAQTVRPAAIILVNSVPPSGVQTKPRPPANYPAVVKWANGPLAETRDAMPDSDEKTILWAWKRWRDESGQVMNTLARGVLVPKPTCPVLCILGTADTDVSHETGLALAQWAGADIHVYRDMSHVGPLMSKRAESVARAACNWVRDLK